VKRLKAERGKTDTLKSGEQKLGERESKLKLKSGKAESSPNFYLGLVNRRERWGLSWIGWLVVLTAVVAVSAGLCLRIYPFLGITERLETPVLVVEGWVHDYAIEAAAEEFRSGRYERVFTTGGPVSGAGRYVNDFQTSASVGAERLQAFGVPADSLQMAPTRVLDRDRTYASAMALREWFHAHAFQPSAINVVTEGPHARRTRLLFQKALGEDTAVGVLAIHNPDYDEKRWWRYSEGVKDVVTETVAYLYTRLFFYPVAEAESVIGSQ
jgi:uncharacterized SAM-binding protein YcdF (DUF218 family)